MLKKRYEKVCNEYMEQFCKKQDLGEYYWVAGVVGSIVHVSDFYFSFMDVVWDVNTNQPKGLIIEWYDSVLESPEKSINYYSYTRGLRV
jgi:hypothetical protein